MIELNIYQRINAAKADEDLSVYLKKGSAGQGTGALYDELISQLGPILTKYGIVVSVDKVGDARSRATAKGVYIYECDFKISYINIDKPEDRLETITESHAMDLGDKAPGKANTYATKTSMLKVFGFETGDNEESRAEIKEASKVISANQHDTLAVYCLETSVTGNTSWSKLGDIMSKTYNIRTLDQLAASKFSEALEKCKSYVKIREQRAQESMQNKEAG